MRKVLALLLLLVASGVASVASASITINYDYIQSYIYNGSTWDYSYLQNTGGGVVTENSLPGYSSTTTTSYTQASFSSAFDQVRGGDYAGYSHSHAYVEFSSDVDVPYTASGAFSNTDGTTYLYSELTDYTTGYSYYSYQYNYGGSATLNLGGLAGNQYSYFEGSLTGTILAGHTYYLTSVAYTQAYPQADMGAVASGGLSLVFDDGTVPEPISVAVWGGLASVAGVIAFRRRQR